MDIVGVGLGSVASLVTLVALGRDAAEYRFVRTVQRSGQPIDAVVTGVDVYRRFDVRSAFRRPVVSYQLLGRRHETSVANYLGAAPEETTLPVLVDPKLPLAVVAADRHDARHQVVVDVGVAVLMLALTVLSVVVF